MSAVSLFYYFRIVRAMYLVDGEGELHWREEPAVAAAIALCVVGTLAMGVLPGPSWQFAKACLLPFGAVSDDRPDERPRPERPAGSSATS